MKTGRKQRQTTTGARRENRLDCTKSVTMKTAKQRRKTTGKKVSPKQSSRLQTQAMQTSFEETTPGNSTFVSRQCLQCAGKLKLQLFPIDEVTRKGVEQGQHNPYLELILSSRKKISSVLKHLNVKWGSSESVPGELMFFPYARTDNLVSHRRWTIKDSDTTAADVYASVGNPAVFRLRYGWFSNFDPTTCGISPLPLNSEDKLQTKEIQPITDAKVSPCPLSSMENEPVYRDNSLNQVTGATLVLDKSTQAVKDNQSVGKSDLLSWADCLSNISIGALLSEAPPNLDANLCSQLPAQKNSSLQQIPITCDSFDAAIASLVAHHQTTNQSTQVPHSSILDAEETCHAFPFSKIAPNNGEPASSKDCLITASISSNSMGLNDMLGTQVGHAPADHFCQEPATNLQIHRMSDVSPGPPAGLQPNTEDNASRELKTSSEPQIEAFQNSDFGRVDIYWPESSAALEYIATCSRQTNNGDTSLGTLFETSLDAFQNFSIF